jgi:hypothetical protein
LYGFGDCFALGFGEVEAGDLEAVEEEAGAAGIDLVAAMRWRTSPMEAWMAERSSGSVVVVAELLLAQARARAAAAVGEDVAASVLFGCFGCRLHRSLPTGYFFAQSLRRKRVKSGLPFPVPVKCESPAGWPDFFSHYFYCMELRGTKMPTLTDLFSLLQVAHFGQFIEIVMWDFGGLGS